MMIKSTSTKEIILHLIRRESSIIFSGTALTNLTITENIDYVTRNILYKIQTMIPSENVKEKTYTVSVSYPDGWFQMLKESHFPKFLKDHFPIKYKTKQKQSHLQHI